MKKIWKKRNEEGVSPVIATILMVAITVVLAAVLYVLVMGMIDKPTDVTPAGSWQSVAATNDTSARLIFGQIGTDTAPKDIRVFVEGPNGIYFTLEISDDLNDRVTVIESLDAPAGVTATYTDLNYEGNSIGSGDYITINGLSTPGVYTVNQFHNPTDAEMIGGKSSFQV